MKPFAYAIRFLIPLSMGTGPALANNSAYTDLNTDHCKKLSTGDEPGGGIVLMCKGYRDHPVYYKEGDLRQAILYGKVNAAYIEGTFETFGAFNYTGGKIEWRLDDAGRPVAAIQRWFISNSGAMEPGPAPADTGQVLVISKVAGSDGKGCVAGYVDALSNPEPNRLARQVADTRPAGFVCAADKAVFHGVRGPLATDPTHSFPQR
ncbi:hypothetical protein [Pararhizobium sp.]|uniref:hypothetical protein n=1 Tax=Pararhizobium sp. TaxID=1977563 RepID=UPI003D116108